MHKTEEKEEEEEDPKNETVSSQLFSWLFAFVLRRRVSSNQNRKEDLRQRDA
jgi:hypothetical protein